MIGILIIAHGSLGKSLVHCASHVMGGKPAQLEFLAVSTSDDPTKLLPKAQKMIANLNAGEGVLVLSDIYGATPCNMVTKLVSQQGVAGVAGVNLPMLVRVLNYRQEALEVCVEKAISGGKEGVVHFTERGCENYN
ncbi:MAG TPA: PTS fructose transporter subunit IIA [Methylophilaceae bacterium]|nr:PTS fructose transporter subunit IIA [Methylophilus sp.]HAF00980.1 PTS fructose transporter subunit IIA [Methylophilaceae bacterium]HAJ70518.1 PTS fructose transporter subunit IIA [Methylophilaceae bacterium]